MDRIEKGEPSKSRSSWRYNVDLSAKERAYLDDESTNTGLSKSDILRGSLRIRQKIQQLNASNVVLAVKDDQGNIIEVGPLTILE